MGTVKKQKRARKSALKNRYCAGAKLSEHKFLRILRGFAEGITLSALEPTAHVSSKTIRAEYHSLRAGVACAALAHPEQFGQAGRILMHERTPELLRAVRHSRRFKRHRQHHAPRLTCPVQADQLVMEKIVRLLCALDLRDLPLLDDEAVGALIESLIDAIPRLHPREPRQKLADFIPGAKPFMHDGLRLYGDFRRYLLKNPLRLAGELVLPSGIG